MGGKKSVIEMLPHMKICSTILHSLPCNTIIICGINANRKLKSEKKNLTRSKFQLKDNKQCCLNKLINIIYTFYTKPGFNIDLFLSWTKSCSSWFSKNTWVSFYFLLLYWYQSNSMAFILVCGISSIYDRDLPSHSPFLVLHLHHGPDRQGFSFIYPMF